MILTIPNESVVHSPQVSPEISCASSSSLKVLVISELSHFILSCNSGGKRLHSKLAAPIASEISSKKIRNFGGGRSPPFQPEGIKIARSA